MSPGLLRCLCRREVHRGARCASWAARILLIAVVLERCHGRDFTQRDIAFLHPSSTPFPGGFKCFTCEDARDNFECNRWAPDHFCPREAEYCLSRHTVDQEGRSVSVTKRCVSLEDCLSPGCTEQDGGQMCTACCGGNICNLAVPWNQSDSLFTSVSAPGGGSTAPASHALMPLVLVLGVVF